METGVDTDYYTWHSLADALPFGLTDGTVMFTGSMNSRSSIEGVGFLMDEVWPLVIEQRPAGRAIIVGRNPLFALVEAARKRRLAWEFTGLVDDVRPFVASSHVYVIPLRVGSGTRIKVFEAMAMGCPVVSTALGVEGLGVTDGTDYLLANTTDAFAEAILALLADAPRRAVLSAAARNLVEQQFGWAQVTQQFEAVLAAMLPNQTCS